MKKKDFNLTYAIHDVKNYVAAAISNLQMASVDHEDLEDNANIAASIDALWLALNSTREIAANVDTSRPDIVSANYTLMSVNEFVTNHTRPFIESLRKIYPSTRINDGYIKIEEDKFVEVDSKSFNQAIGNIIGNAISAGASLVDIHAVMRAYCLVITIHDNGSGMSSEEVDKIMLSQFGDGKVHGVGTRSILVTAALHDFPLTYTSVEGEGTTIRILVPYINTKLTAPSAGQAVPL